MAGHELKTLRLAIALARCTVIICLDMVRTLGRVLRHVQRRFACVPAREDVVAATHMATLESVAAVAKSREPTVHLGVAVKIAVRLARAGRVAVARLPPGALGRAAGGAPAATAGAARVQRGDAADGVVRAADERGDAVDGVVDGVL